MSNEAADGGQGKRRARGTTTLEKKGVGTKTREEETDETFSRAEDVPLVLETATISATDD